MASTISISQASVSAVPTTAATTATTAAAAAASHHSADQLVGYSHQHQPDDSETVHRQSAEYQQPVEHHQPAEHQQPAEHHPAEYHAAQYHQHLGHPSADQLHGQGHGPQAWAAAASDPRSGPESDPATPHQEYSTPFSPVPTAAVPIPLSIITSPTTSGAVFEAQLQNAGIHEPGLDRPFVGENKDGILSEAVADLGLTFIPRNPAILADSISNADFDVAPELASSAASLAPSSFEQSRSFTSDNDHVQTPLTPGNLASIPDLHREHFDPSPQQQQQQQQQQQLEDEYLRSEYASQQYFQQQPSPLIEMELSRLAERERNMCAEVQAFLANMAPEHQSFWLSQRRDRLRLTAEERHKFIVHQALACNPLLTTDEVNEFCMHQQGMIFEDLRAEGAPICSTAWFDWRLDKDLWDRWVGSATGEPSMWADDPPPLDRAPYLDGYKLTVLPPPSSSPTTPPPFSPDPYYVLHSDGHPDEDPARRLLAPSAPGPVVADESKETNPAQYFGDHDVRSTYREPESPMMGGGSRARTPNPGPSATAPITATSTVPTAATNAVVPTGSNVQTPPKPSRPHSKATNSGFRSPRRTSFGVDTATPSSRGGDSSRGGLDSLSQLHEVGGLGHIESAKGMPSLFKAVNYQPVVWGER